MHFNRPVKPTSLDEAIESAIQELKSHDANSDEYRNIVNQITALNAVQETKKDRVSKDTLLLVLGNITGIILIVGHERAHIVTSKALSLVGKSFK